MRVLENGANGRAELFAASVALPDALADRFLRVGTRFQLTSVSDLSALRADGAIRPTQLFKEVASCFFIVKMLIDSS